MASENREAAKVTDPTYAGVSVNHPTVKSMVQEMTKKGEPIEKISRVVGMPPEVIRRHQRDLNK